MTRCGYCGMDVESCLCGREWDPPLSRGEWACGGLMALAMAGLMGWILKVIA